MSTLYQYQDNGINTTANVDHSFNTIPQAQQGRVALPLKINAVDKQHTIKVRWPQPQLHLMQESHRKVVEGYIATRYAQVYRAQLDEFMPYLLSLKVDQEFAAALGIRIADQQSLYLERYLQNPVQTYIEKENSQPIARKDIAEIGNLAATQRGSSRILFLLMALVLEQLDVHWLVFTSTPQVESLINKVELKVQTLYKIKTTKLNTQLNKKWGSYYQHSPKVVVGNLDEALFKVREHSALKYIVERYQQSAIEVASRIKQSVK